MVNFEEKISRRKFLNVMLSGSIAALGAGVIYPILRYINPPKAAEDTSSDTVAAKTTDLPLNTAKIFRFGQKPGILIHTAQDEYKAFSAVCTHLNCTVQYDKDTAHIWCACHNGHFDLNGRVISGPPPKALEEFNVSVRGEDIVVARK